MIGNEWNFNSMNSEDYEAMKQGIKENYEKGLPLWIGEQITVCELSKSFFRILDGNHRVRACLELKIGEIPDSLILNLGNISEIEQRRITEIKNTRGSRNEIKYALFLKKQLGLEGITQTEFAQKRKISKGNLSKILKRTEMSKELQEKVSLAKLPSSIIDEILTLPKEQWNGAFDYVMETSATRRETRELVTAVKQKEISLKKKGKVEYVFGMDKKYMDMLKDVWKEQKQLGFKGSFRDFLDLLAKWVIGVSSKLSKEDLTKLLKRENLIELAELGFGDYPKPSPELDKAMEKATKEFEKELHKRSSKATK